jgi:hypothetical protein
MNSRLTLSVDQFLLSSDLGVHYWPIVANTFIKKSTLSVLSSLYDDFELDLELWRWSFKIKYWSPTLEQKMSYRKTLNFHRPKISLLALHTASLEPGWGRPVKSHKIDRKIDFFLNKFWKNKKKSWVLIWPGIKSLQDSLKTSIPIFDFWNSLFQIVNMVSWAMCQLKFVINWIKIQEENWPKCFLET